MDFEKRFDELRRECEHKDEFEKVSAFLSFHLEWAEALAASDPAGAIQRFEAAENYQSTIGTFASGSGEGLASMGALYEIMGKRALATERLADLATDRGSALVRLNEALALWSQIKADPNGMGDDTPAASKIDLLRSRIEMLKHP
jgi:hypothetical protein